MPHVSRPFDQSAGSLTTPPRGCWRRASGSHRPTDQRPDGKHSVPGGIRCMGKTMLLREILARQRHVVRRDEECVQPHPVVLVLMPEEPTEEAFYVQVLKAVAAPLILSPRRHMLSVRETTFRILRELGTRMLSDRRDQFGPGRQPTAAAAVSSNCCASCRTSLAGRHRLRRRARSTVRTSFGSPAT